MTLAKMGMPVRIFDFDTVEEVNVGTQFFRQDQIGMLKAEAIEQTANAHSREGLVRGIALKLDATTDPFGEISGGDDILITALDSLKTRQELWPIFENAPWELFLDMRMAAELLTVYSVSTAEDAQKYENILMAQDPENIPELACTEKATVYTANFAAGWAAILIRRFYMDKKVPFLLSHDLINVNISHH